VPIRNPGWRTPRRTASNNTTNGPSISTPNSPCKYGRLPTLSPDLRFVTKELPRQPRVDGYSTRIRTRTGAMFRFVLRLESADFRPHERVIATALVDLFTCQRSSRFSTGHATIIGDHRVRHWLGWLAARTWRSGGNQAIRRLRTQGI
jgi:hypothetical protein